MPPAIASEIRWGTGFDNVVHFDTMPTAADERPQGLDDVVTWDDPAPGSRRTRNDAGVTDAWERNYDYKLAGRARYFDAASLAELQDFLRNAGRGNTFRFIPDRRYPSFYIGDCYLDTPYDDRRPQPEQSDGSKSIDIVIRQQAYDFGLARRGLMFEYRPGSSITEPSSMLATFTRATTATRIGRDRVLASAASGELRNRHFVLDPVTGLYRQATLLERLSANGALRSQEFDNASWAKSNVTVGVNAIAAPDGTVTADNLSATAAAATTCNQSATAAATVYTFSVYVKKGVGSGGNYTNVFGIRNSTTATDLLFVSVNFALGTVTDTTGTGGKIEAHGDWYRVIMPVTSGISIGNTITTYVGFAGGVYAAGDNVYAWGAQLEAGPAATSYKATTTGTVTRNADELSFPFPHAPQAMTIYAKFVERGAILEAFNAGVVGVLEAAGGNPLVLLYQTGGFYNIAHHNGTTQVNSALATAPSWGNLVELRGVLNSDGSVQIGQSINGAAEVVASASAAIGLPAAWSDDTLQLNRNGSGGVGTNAFYLVKTAPGPRTLAEMRAA